MELHSHRKCKTSGFISNLNKTMIFYHIAIAIYSNIAKAIYDILGQFRKS